MENKTTDGGGKKTGMRLPVVAVVGRPNVGKSTIFNRIIGKRLAVIEDTPGVTRDRIYADTEWQTIPFTIVDTGGVLFQQDDPLIDQVRLQAEIAIRDADIILFMVDVKDGMTPADQELADLLRGTKKPMMILVNKADNEKLSAEATEFHQLGLCDVMAISSLHGTGVADLLDWIVDRLPRGPETLEEEDIIRIAIVGKPNVGKSSLYNAILGEKRAIVSDIPGTTRDAIDTTLQWGDQKLTIVDTAGLRSPGKVQGTLEYYTTLRAERAIDKADVVLIVIDGNVGLTDGDKRVGRITHEKGKALVWVVNKWDLIEPPDGKPKKRSDEKIEFAESTKRDMPSLNYAVVTFISALERTGIEPMIETALSAADNHAFRIGTGNLNRIIRDAVFERPPSHKGDPIKIYYATMPVTNPPTVVLFTNDPKNLHFTYKRYLENRLRKEFPLEGTQIRIQTRLSGKDEFRKGKK